MFGATIGARIGARIGSRIGLVGDTAVVNPMAGVTKDATSGKYCPSTLGEWTTTMSVASLATGNPSIITLAQDASGDMLDASGNGFTLTMSGTPSYQQVVPGWSRKAILGTDGGAATATSTDLGLPDPASASILMLGYFYLSSTPATIRNVQSWASGSLATSRLSATPNTQGVSGASVVTGTADPTGTRPFALKYDFTHSTVTIYTDQEKLTPTFAAASTRRHRLHFDFAGGCLYQSTFFNAAAELSDANVKTLLQTLGFTVAW